MGKSNYGWSSKPIQTLDRARCSWELHKIAGNKARKKLSGGRVATMSNQPFSRMQGLQNRPHGLLAKFRIPRLPRGCHFCVSAEIARMTESRENSAETQPSSALTGSARSSPDPWNLAENSAETQFLATAAVPARGSRGPSSSASRPRRLSWARLQPFSAGCGAEFCEPCEPRGDSDRGWVWLGLRVQFGLVLTANF